MRKSNMSNYFLPRMIICENGEGCGTETQSSTIDDDDENYNEKEVGKNESREGENDEKQAEGGHHHDRSAPNYNGGKMQSEDDPRAAVALAEKSLTKLHLGNNNHFDSKSAATATTAPTEVALATSSEDNNAASSSPQQPYYSNKPSMVEEQGELSSLYVGRIIGKGGEMIRDLQARSGCHIDVNQNVEPDAPRIITYRGRRQEDIDFAKRLVDMLCTTESSCSDDGSGGGGSGSTPRHHHHHHHAAADLPLGKATMKQIQVPKSVIGKIIGRGGETIRELQSKSLARIQVDHGGEYAGGMDSADRHHRQVTITGTKESVFDAEQRILFLTTNVVTGRERRDWNGRGSGGHAWRHSRRQEQEQQGMIMPPPSGPSSWQVGGFEAVGNPNSNASYGGGGYDNQQHPLWDGSSNQYNAALPMIETDVIPCNKSDVGHIIGRKGATIKDLQRRTSCNIQIDQREFQISITGPRQGIEMAKQLLREIIEQGNQITFVAGGGLEEQDSYQGQQLQQQQPPALGGYALDQQQQQQHHFQQPHGGYPNDSYGILPPQQQYYGGHGIMYHQQQQPPSQPYPILQAQQDQEVQEQYPVVAQVSPWVAATTADGRIYYWRYNHDALETVWEKPAGMQ